MEDFQGVDLLAHTEELDRLAGDMTYRQRRATTGITVNLGENHTGQRQGLVEGLGGVGRILTGHGIDHKQGFCRLGCRMHLFDLGHHLVIDVQTTGGIDNQHIHEAVLRLTHRCFNNGYRLLLNRRREELDLHICRQGFELLDRRRTVNIGTDHHDLFLFALAQGLGQLAHTGGFTGTLQTRHQNHCRRTDRQVQPLGLPHDRLKLGFDDLDEDLARRQAARHLGAHSALAHLINKGLDHRQRDVGLQQRHAHFAQGVLDVLFGQLGLSGHATQAV